MKTPKLKTYVLMLAKNFPSHHYLKGRPTDFVEKARRGDKIHTIRVNAELWAKRIDEVNAGLAIISVRQWSAKPYNSPQQEVFRMYKCSYDFILHGSGRYLILNKPAYSSPEQIFEYEAGYEEVAENDGLSINEFTSWFSKLKTDKSLIIIYFKGWRYFTDGPYDTKMKCDSYLIPTQN